MDPLSFGILTNLLSEALLEALRVGHPRLLGDAEQRTVRKLLDQAVDVVKASYPQERDGTMQGQPVDYQLRILTKSPAVAQMLLRAVLDGSPLDTNLLGADDYGFDPATAQANLAELIARLHGAFAVALHAEVERPGSPLFPQYILALVRSLSMEYGRHDGLRTMPHSRPEESLKKRLGQLPPQLGPLITANYRDDPQGVWAVVTALTRDDTLPGDVLQQWQSRTPPWLANTSWPAMITAGELAAAYSAAPVAVRLLTLAIDRGTVRDDYWAARAIVLSRSISSDHDATPTVSPAAPRPLALSDDPYASAVLAWMNGSRDEASRLVRAWAPTDPAEATARALLQALIWSPAIIDGDRSDIVDQTLNVLRDTWRRTKAADVGLAYAALIGSRPHRSRDDLDEIGQVALEARDVLRRCRANSAPAVAIACRAASGLGDWPAIIKMTTVCSSGATTAEADASDVRVEAAIAAMATGDLDTAARHIAAASADCTPSTLHLLHGHLADHRDGNPEPDYRLAIEHATHDGELIAALSALAKRGVPNLPRLDDLGHRRSWAAAEIAADAAHAQGRTDDAIRILRPASEESLEAALRLATIYREAGQTDRVIGVLLTAADRFNDLDLRLAAAELLIEDDNDLQQARSLLTDLLTRQPARIPLRHAAHGHLANLAMAGQQYEDAARHLFAILREEPSNTSVRWGLIQVFDLRGDLDAARRVLREAPDSLKPVTGHQALLWVRLQRDELPRDAWAGQLLELLHQFSSSPDVRDFILAELYTASGDEPFPPHVAAQLQAQTERLLTDLSAVLDDPDGLASYLGDQWTSNDRRPPQAAVGTRGTQFENVSLADLAYAIGMTLTETAILRGTGVLRIHSNDPDEIADCAAGLSLALDTDVVVDIAALLTLSLLPREIADCLTGRFTRIHVPEPAMRDASVAHYELAKLQHRRPVYNRATRSIESLDLPSDQVPQYADEARRVIATAKRFAIIGATQPVPGDSADPRYPVEYAINVAAARRYGMWSDDPATRALARSRGIPAFSTTSALQYSHQLGQLDDQTYEHTIRQLILHHLGDIPTEPDRLLAMARDGDWTAGPVAAALSRSSAWQDPQTTMRLFLKIIYQVIRHRTDQIAEWMHAAAQALSITPPDDTASEFNTAVLLALAIPAAIGRPEAIRQLVEGSRTGLRAARDRTDLDPLSAAAKLLQKTYFEDMPPDLATRAVKQIFNALDDQDRIKITEALLQ